MKHVLIWGYLIDWGGHIHVTYCKDQTFHAQVRDICKSLISIDRFKTSDQNSKFLSFGGKMVIKNLLIFEKEALKPVTSTR